MNKQRNEIDQKYGKKITKIKDICSTYFQKYDSDLLDLKVNMKTLN